MKENERKCLLYKRRSIEENTSDSAMLNIPEPVPPPESITIDSSDSDHYIIHYTQPTTISSVHSHGIPELDPLAIINNSTEFLAIPCQTGIATYMAY